MPKPLRFDTGRNRRRRRAGRRARIGWPALVVLLLSAAWLIFGDRLSPPPQEDEVVMSFRLCGTKGSGPCVIDGDTVAIGQRRVRLTGYDAPEMDGECEAERVKALEAKARLHAWLAKGRFSWTGGADPPRDQYGRELREVRRGDELLAENMVSAGLAGQMGWGARAIDWCEP